MQLLTGQKKQINCLQWNQNGNWLATGAKDQAIKIYDIRTMREFTTLRGHNADVTSVAWHPEHESLLASGGFNGSLCYWCVGQSSEPHTGIAQVRLRWLICFACILLFCFEY